MYDCTQDVNQHVTAVCGLVSKLCIELAIRGYDHDASKLQEPEKGMYDEYVPKLKTTLYGSLDYKADLAAMDEGLAHHYANNRHHPQHFPNGISGMTLIDLIEMLCDWKAAADAKGVPLELDYNADRFGIDKQLTMVLQNTLDALAK